MKIAIAGAGAMGSRFGLMLHQGGNEVLLIDGWADHVQQIKEHGLKADFNGEEVVEKLPVVLQSEVGEEDQVDLIILFTKAMQLEKMLTDIRPLIKEETEVLCLLNGIGHEDIIEKFVPMANIYIGNTMWTAGLEGPGKVKLFGSGSIELQNLGEGKEEQAKALAEKLSESGLHAKFSDNIHYSIYRKACVNGTMNGLCTILDVNMAGLGQTSTAHKMVETIVREFAAVAEAENIYLDIPEVIAHCESCFDPETIGLHYPSMYQDLIKNHRLTEIDYINGAVSRKGKKYGIATPYCDFLTELIHAKEDSLQVK
ncbi:2-dehydropantoate 2-reductase [Enterococcus hirae]|uniref:2-dehydropantoate 2-reductase n=1 Tax=Enterococcus TaxID=1350 RepID=UPI001376B087|nr:2-dehydropantoate 2-reductase [Enterococcus hirae]EMF0261588.1 2-dehydropantoate 2-reductase [Enterococcus hirae]EMF0566278.1 2-dehydropantoate 2-reductase [Enterococcus hirae]MBO1089270.1 2-dehydropantoate 2-reductase [Enterococcus hirae]MCK6146932.1 2-dehydropantoate 2-reductase [Enterococcus hirae]MCK6174657.1 2-dehydropantoate 2-reductase [Enterococcus hirae]